jgi:uncharacterized delta-60 repeat protein
MAVMFVFAVFISSSLTNRAQADDELELDLAFGIGGKVVSDFDQSAGANDVAIQADGKIVAAGWIYSGSTRNFALARYNADGSLDQTFGTGGKATRHFSTNDRLTSVTAHTSAP